MQKVTRKGKGIKSFISGFDSFKDGTTGQDMKFPNDLPIEKYVQISVYSADVSKSTQKIIDSGSSAAGAVQAERPQRTAA